MSEKTTVETDNKTKIRRCRVLRIIWKNHLIIIAVSVVVAVAVVAVMRTNKPDRSQVNHWRQINPKRVISDPVMRGVNNGVLKGRMKKNRFMVVFMRYLKRILNRLSHCYHCSLDDNPSGSIIQWIIWAQTIMIMMIMRLITVQTIITPRQINNLQVGISKLWRIRVLTLRIILQRSDKRKKVV